MDKLGDILLAAVLVIMICLVALFGPEQITQVALDLLGWTPDVALQQAVTREERIGRELLDSITEPEVRETLSRFASLRSRVVGYPGIEEAYQYVKGQFEEIGLEGITTETFKVTVPVDKGASLVISDTGEEIPLYCL